nr:hypothetical protein [uncultured Psychroserpens sp.]
MKKLIVIFVFAFTLQLSAQDQSKWLTDNTIALKQSDNQNKPILVFVTDNQKSEAYQSLKNNFFNSDAFKNYASKSILLKLDVSDKNSSNARLGIHYTKQTNALGIALIDKNGRTISDPLVADFSMENVTKFMTLWNANL